MAEPRDPFYHTRKRLQDLMLWRLPVVSIQVVSIQVYSFEVYIVPPACLKEQGYSPKIFFLFTRKLHWKWTKCLCNFTAWVCIEMTGHFAITCYPYSWQVIYLFLEMPLFYAEMCITNSWFTTAGLDHLGKTLFFVYSDPANAAVSPRCLKLWKC